MAVWDGLALCGGSLLRRKMRSVRPALPTMTQVIGAFDFSVASAAVLRGRSEPQSYVWRTIPTREYTQSTIPLQDDDAVEIA
jgi:hypothetical protein